MAPADFSSPPPPNFLSSESLFSSSLHASLLLRGSDEFGPLFFSLNPSPHPSFLNPPALCTINQLPPPASLHPSLNPLVPSVVLLSPSPPLPSFLYLLICRFLHFTKSFNLFLSNSVRLPFFSSFQFPALLVKYLLDTFRKTHLP